MLEKEMFLYTNLCRKKSPTNPLLTCSQKSGVRNVYTIAAIEIMGKFNFISESDNISKFHHF